MGKEKLGKFTRMALENMKTGENRESDKLIDELLNN